MLIDILQEISEEEGQNLSDPKDKSRLITRVNRAAKEFHEASDFKEIMDERVVDYNVATQQVVLPFYMYQVRGGRFESALGKVEIHDPLNRYNHGPDNELWPLRLRDIGFRITERNINNESILKCSIKEVEPTDISITIIGTTSNSNRREETIIIPAGELEAEGIVNFVEPLFSITKNQITISDIEIKDVSENVLAKIPNWSNYINYKVFQVTDAESVTTLNDALEVRFKWIFFKVLEDKGLFFGTEKYDRCIIYKYKSIFSESLKVQAAMEIRIADLIKNIRRSEEVGTDKKIDLVPPGLMHPVYARYDRTFGYFRNQR